jgi:phosphopantothenoylcysteine synthetase/decarboxylase
MADENALFLFVTGAGPCDLVPDMIRDFIDHEFEVYSVLTPNVSLVKPVATLMEVPGNHWIHEYRQTPLDRYPFGALLVAPCTFNTFNKIALGLADNLATSMIADGLGAGCPVIIAPAMNHGLWSHPQTAASLERLRSWGCEIVMPTVTDQSVTMAPIEDVVETVLRVARS